jgi:sodium-dependent dicarboxylate transporter 2/3/5
LATVAVSDAVQLDPRLVMIPATIAASCAFMLPIATPPNAIVFGSGQVPMQQMLRRGFVLNLLSVVLITIVTFLLIVPQLGITVGGVPDWAR